jgi:PAT family beta-lactamase induction signal transducer AmpG
MWQTLQAYRDRRILAVLLLGFSSGFPLALTGSTLAFRLAELKVSLATIGAFSLVGMFYSFKWVWSPVVDQLKLPVLSMFGRRRSWIVLSQAGLVAVIAALGWVDPVAAPTATAGLAAAVAFLSATQDIAIDAWRIELLPKEQQGAGAAAVQWGYRLGMIASGAGALYAAQAWDWTRSYYLMAAIAAACIAATLWSPEPLVPEAPKLGIGAALYRAVIAPFADFRHRRLWAVVLLAAVVFRFGDAFAGVMASPLYQQLGFTKAEVASVTKVFGVFASLGGVAAGGAIVARLGPLRSLLVCGSVTMLSNLLYAVQAVVGNNLGVLTLTIGLENFAGGMSTAAYVAWISTLCSPGFAATQYALLSSLASVGRTTLAASGGWVAERTSWPIYFLIAACGALPGLALVSMLSRANAEEEPAKPAT